MPRVRLVALRLLRSFSSQRSLLLAGRRNNSGFNRFPSVFTVLDAHSRPCSHSLEVCIASERGSATAARNDSIMLNRPPSWRFQQLSTFSSTQVISKRAQNHGPLRDSSVAEGLGEAEQERNSQQEDESSVGRDDSFEVLDTSADSNGMSLYPVYEAEVITEPLPSSTSTGRYRLEADHGSDGSDCESDADLLSDREISEPELSDPEFEEGWTLWQSHHEKEDVAVTKIDSELHEWGILEMQEISDRLPSNEDSGESIATVSERSEGDGRAYLHVLSVDEIREILEKARAKDVTILHVGDCCEWVDHMVFASGRSTRHLRGLADALVYKVKQLSENVGPNSFPTVEGREGERWMAIDCGGIVVHLFLEEARNYYDLEEFWRRKTNPRLVENF